MTAPEDHPPTPLATVLASARLEGDLGEAELPPDWTQGRTIYGGLTVAAGLHALRAEAPELPPLRSLLVQFVGPVTPGTVTLERRLLREGTSLTQVALEISQDETPRAILTASYGVARRSQAERSGPPPPDCPGPEEGTPMEHQPGLTPVFMRHLDYRITLGFPPISGAPAPLLGGWYRLRDPGPVHPEPLAALLVDAWPPPALSMLTRPRPASTVSWHLATTPAIEQADPGAWHLIRTDALHAGQGFAPVRAELWNPQGHVLAISQQVDVVFG